MFVFLSVVLPLCTVIILHETLARASLCKQWLKPNVVAAGDTLAANIVACCTFLQWWCLWQMISPRPHSRDGLWATRFFFFPSSQCTIFNITTFVASVCVYVCACVNVSAGCSGVEWSLYFNLPVFFRMICFLLVDLHFIADANRRMRLATCHCQVCTSSGACCIVFFEPRAGQNFHEPFTCPS